MTFLKDLRVLFVCYLKIATFLTGLFQMLIFSFVLLGLSITDLQRQSAGFVSILKDEHFFISLYLFASLLPMIILYPLIFFVGCIGSIILRLEGKPVIETMQKETTEIWENQLGPNEYPFYFPGVLALMRGKDVALYFFLLWAPLGAVIAVYRFWPEELFPNYDYEEEPFI